MNKETEPGHYRAFDGVLCRWIRCDSSYIRQYYKVPQGEWESTGCVHQRDIKLDRDKLDELIAYEDEQMDWVELGDYLRCLRNGTKPQHRNYVNTEWEDYDEPVKIEGFPTLLEAYRMGFINGREWKCHK